MYSPRMICVLFTAVVCLQVSSSTPTQHELELKQHYEHLMSIAAFKCLVPQPRVIPVHKLLNDCQTKGKAYFPDVTVLHRCDCETGTCTSGQTCSAEVFEAVSLPFKVTFLENIDHHKIGSWLIEYHTILNHTHCACVDDYVPEQTTLISSSFNELPV